MSKSRTAGFFARFGDVPKRSIRQLGGFDVSAFGFGCYRVTDADPRHRAALETAIVSGCNLFDTSPSYCDGASERLLGRTLAAAVERGGFRREDFCVVTKVGSLQGARLADARRRAREGAGWRGAVDLSPDAQFCLDPAFIAHEVRHSRPPNAAVATSGRRRETLRPSRRSSRVLTSPDPSVRRAARRAR